ncbi:MAG: protein-tyrosine-phosphatase [Lachnospiraceae bacterium]|nr:protein-tyrosine-phosphatase [Lachnospiraceae bacterium]
MGYIDVHSHIIPGVDDGSKDMEMTLNMLKIAAHDGVTEIFATPHNMPGKGKADFDIVWDGIEAVQKAADEQGIDIIIYPGCEYFFREEILTLMQEERIVPMGNSDIVLVEFDPGADFPYIRNSLQEVLSMAYRPLLAHVERYASVIKDKKNVEYLRDIGVLIQTNAQSVTGKAGAKIKTAVNGLLKHGDIDFIGSDAHRDTGSRTTAMAECVSYLYKKYDERYVEGILRENAVQYGMLDY